MSSELEILRQRSLKQTDQHNNVDTKTSEEMEKDVSWMSKAGQDQVSLQKISDTVTSGNIFSEKPVSAKNGQGLIQEISRNFNESGTPSSIQDYNSTCALPLDPPEISLTSGKENIIHLYQRASDAEGLAMKANQKEILSWSKIRKSSLA
ncbi:hypothetical protein RhiirC2_792487 [Rhizophagus irregularis]|uniref:Uncharacterized protein n=1 Tax=Rhizophagus irregularis TaxID=588596 RepID=A0A2N1MH78_9GLOM|nr:hypothetical protein RhiirC2_792487 [Rhizophagus irregularis]